MKTKETLRMSLVFALLLCFGLIPNAQAVNTLSTNGGLEEIYQPQQIRVNDSVKLNGSYTDEEIVDFIEQFKTWDMTAGEGGTQTYDFEAMANALSQMGDPAFVAAVLEKMSGSDKASWLDRFGLGGYSDATQLLNCLYDTSLLEAAKAMTTSSKVIDAIDGRINQIESFKSDPGKFIEQFKTWDMTAGEGGTQTYDYEAMANALSQMGDPAFVAAVLEKMSGSDKASWLDRFGLGGYSDATQLLNCLYDTSLLEAAKAMTTSSKVIDAIDGRINQIESFKSDPGKFIEQFKTWDMTAGEGGTQTYDYEAMANALSQMGDPAFVAAVLEKMSGSDKASWLDRFGLGGYSDATQLLNCLYDTSLLEAAKTKTTDSKVIDAIENRLKELDWAAR